MVDSACAFLNTRLSPGFSWIPGRTRAPSMLWGFASAPRPSPARSNPRTVPTQHSGTCVRAGTETRMALCPPPSRVPLSLGFCSFSFSMDAQPRDCASFLLPVLQGPGAGGPDTPQGKRALPLLHPPQVPSPPAATPASSRPRGRSPREAAWSAAAPPAGRWSGTPNAPSRRRRC